MMRLNLKPAAALAAAAFLLLLILDLVWPGHGVWLLIFGILVGLAAAGMWWRDRLLMLAASQPHAPRPISSVSAYGISGSSLQISPPRDQKGVPLSLVLAPISALSILLFIGGALGSSDSQLVQEVELQQTEVAAIDRSRDAESPALQPTPPAATKSTSSASAQSAVTSETQTQQDQAPAPVRPIVVAAPAAATADQQAQAAAPAPESIRTVEYTVEEGDTLYEIAVQHDATVEAIMDINGLDSQSYIHPGDVLRIPINDDES